MHVTFADILLELGANQDRSRGSVSGANNSKNVLR